MSYIEPSAPSNRTEMLDKIRLMIEQVPLHNFFGIIDGKRVNIRDFVLQMAQSNFNWEHAAEKMHQHSVRTHHDLTIAVGAMLCLFHLTPENTHIITQAFDEMVTIDHKAIPKTT